MEHVLVRNKHALSSCTQGFVPPTHTHPLSTTTTNPPVLPCSITSRAITLLKSSHASSTFCYVHLLGLKRKLCSLGVGSNAAGTRTSLTLLLFFFFCQKTITGADIYIYIFLVPPPTAGCGIVALQAQESKTHISPPNLTVCSDFILVA